MIDIYLDGTSASLIEDVQDIQTRPDGSTISPSFPPRVRLQVSYAKAVALNGFLSAEISRIDKAVDEYNQRPPHLRNFRFAKPEEFSVTPAVFPLGDSKA